MLDDHAAGSRGCAALADTVRYSAYGILLLIAGATAAAVSFATRAGLDAHHEMVALLHQMGALPGFIARAVEWHYFVSALLAALLGTVCAALLFLGAGGLEVFGVEAVPFLPPLSLRWTEIPWLAGRAGGHRADRLGDGAHLGAFGGAGHLLECLSRQALLSALSLICAFLAMIFLVVLAYAAGLCAVRLAPAAHARRHAAAPTASWR